MKGVGGRVRVKSPIQTQTASCPPFRANFDTMWLLPLLLFVSTLQPVTCSWADILRTTTPTTPNPDKPGKTLFWGLETEGNMIFDEGFFWPAYKYHLGHRSLLLTKTWVAHCKKKQRRPLLVKNALKVLSLLRMQLVDKIGEDNCKWKSNSIPGNFYLDCCKLINCRYTKIIY